jgi:cyclopropane fatty-acyl-phospholipid synthase-like methyltransferase
MSTNPTGEGIGELYDRLMPLFQILNGNNVHFGYWADPTDDQLPMDQAQEKLTDFFIPQMQARPGQHILDVGCGAGQATVRLAWATGAHVTGITLSPVQRDVATELAQAAGVADRVRFEVADAMAMPFAPASFDMAWAIESPIHMPSRLQMFQNLVRVVRPGGRVMITDVVLAHPLAPEQAAVIRSMFNIEQVGSLEEYITQMKTAGIMKITCQDLTANIWRPFHRHGLVKLHDAAIVAQLREHYDDAMIQSFREGWQVLTDASDRFFYVVLIGECPPAA